MKDYTYTDLLHDLTMGREIHFIYKKENYYIGRGSSRFMFWKFYDSTSEIIGEDAGDLLRKIKLDGQLIKELWDSIEIDVY